MAEGLAVVPVLSYPRQAESGRTYLLTVDLRPSGPAGWAAEMGEEVLFRCVLNTHPLFRSEAVGDPSLVCHRFGGTYGPARFLLTAADADVKGTLSLTLTNEWGVPVALYESDPIHVRSALDAAAALSNVRVVRRTEAVAAEPDEPELTSRPTVQVGSFSYKGGYPEESGGHGGGFVFDVRAIHNPAGYAEFAPLSGCDEPVVYFLEQQPEVEEFLNDVHGLVDFSVNVYLQRGFVLLNVWFGCTGGQHRSVYFANRLANDLRRRFPSITVVVTHREEATWTTRQVQVETQSDAKAAPDPAVGSAITPSSEIAEETY